MAPLATINTPSTRTNRPRTCSCRWWCWRFCRSPEDGGPRRTCSAASIYSSVFSAPVFGGAAGEAAAVSQGAGGNELLAALLGAPVIAGLLGFLLAWWLYIRRPELPDRIAQSLAAPYRLLSGKYFVDELYAAVIVRPLLWLSTNVLWHGIDERVIDGTVNGIGHDAEKFGERVRHLSSGNTRTYATWVVFGAVLLTIVLVWMAG